MCESLARSVPSSRLLELRLRIPKEREEGGEWMDEWGMDGQGAGRRERGKTCAGFSFHQSILPSTLPTSIHINYFCTYFYLVKMHMKSYKKYTHRHQ